MQFTSAQGRAKRHWKHKIRNNEINVEKGRYMYACFWSIINIINTSPSNFAFQLEQSVPWYEECGAARSPRDSVHLDAGRGTGSCGREYNKQNIECWSVANYSWKQAVIFELRLYAIFAFSLKQLPYYFYSVTYFSTNHLTIDLIFGELWGKLWI